MNFVVVKSYDDYNRRRYSAPWVCKIADGGKFNFAEEIGTYTGNADKGEGGDLVIFDPVVDQVYAYGQKDYRGNNTEINFVKWDGETFVECDKLGRLKK